MLPKLLSLLKEEAPPEPYDWLVRVMEQQAEKFVQRQFYFAFSGATRHFDKRKTISVTEDQTAVMQKDVPGFTIENWTLDRLARVVLLLDLATQHRDDFFSSLTAMLETADIREAVVIYGALPLLPGPDSLVPLAREGLRTNIVDVFDSIALENPFPHDHLDTNGWNQMVLKAMFMARPLYRIYGLDGRANVTLAEALSNYAHERWAAGRSVSPELWRPCQGYLDETIVDDLERVAASDEPGQKAAVALVYAHAADTGNAEKLAALRETAEVYEADLASGALTWNSLGKDLESKTD